MQKAAVVVFAAFWVVAVDVGVVFGQREAGKKVILDEARQQAGQYEKA